MSDTSSVAISGSHETGADSRVELRLPADGAFVSVLRTLTAGLAARLDFTLDDIEDLRIAVSEAVAMVLDQADAGTELVCSFELHPGRLTLTITGAARTPESPDYESFGWQVLATLTTEADIKASPGAYAVRLVVTSSLEPAVA
ncbi:MAG: anti-sigma factor [Nocardioidaceae bacterium]|nr:anti-sigma factor [Nocardioidaceae bacterium]MCL2612738.1 anti-sigma factor [Nocardioidaceae bacterium]